MARRPKKPVKKEKKNYALLIVLGIVVVGLSSGFAFFGHGNGGQTEKYNDIKFSFKGEYWSAKFDGREAAFTFPPSQVEHIETDPAVDQLMRGKVQIDTTSSINDSDLEAIGLAQYQLGLSLAQFETYLRPGYIENTTDPERQAQIPIITCQGASQFVPVIFFQTANETKITTQGNCIVAQATHSTDMIRVKDRLLYSYFGVI